MEIEEKGTLIKILENGICGTDREVINGELRSSLAPQGYDFMALGHEAIGQVMEDTENFRRGEIVMPVNRRGCGRCLNCLLGRPDFCETGDFVEAGIKGMHGFMREYIRDDDRFLVKVPADIRDVAIMAQPLSDLEKSLEEILNVQKRMYWACPDGTYGCRHALVVGTGTIGILFSMLLRSRGFEVTIANRREPTEREERIFKETEILFYNSEGGYSALAAKGRYDLVVESSGSDATIVSDVIPLLKNNGMLGLFGFIRNGTAHMGSEILQNIVYKSLAVVGLINGQKPHFEEAMRDLVQWKHQWPQATGALITASINLEDGNKLSVALSKKQKGEIKTRIMWK